MINTKNCDIIVMGGMGPMAGLELHKLLITLNKNVKKDQDHKSILHLCYPNKIGDRTTYLLSNKKVGENPGQEALDILTNNNISKDIPYILGVPCNTFHSSKIFNVFSEGVLKLYPNIKIIHMVNLVLEKVKRFSKVGLLCTAGTKKTKIYGENMIMYPDQNKIDDLIYNSQYGIKSLSYISPYVEKELFTIIDEMDVDCVILGCTELCLLETTTTNKKILINPLEILANELLTLSSTYSKL